MMVRLLFLLSAFNFLAPVNSWCATRAIMEGVAATSNTIFIDTTNVRVGIGKISPTTALDVSGVVTATSYAGSGASLTGVITSSVPYVPLAGGTMTGQLTLAGSTLTVTGPLGVNVTYGVTAGTFTGNGAALTSLTAANISAGSLGASVMASSVAVGAFYSADPIRTNLGLAIGTNVQAWDADLDTLATLDGSALLKISSVAVNAIYPAAVSAGTYSNITLPAANVAAGQFSGDYTFYGENPILTIKNNDQQGFLDFYYQTDLKSWVRNYAGIASPYLQIGTNLPKMIFDMAGTNMLVLSASSGTLTGGASLDVKKAGDTMDGPLTLTSTLTVTGNAFSVGGSTFSVSQGVVTISGGAGTIAPLLVYSYTDYPIITARANGVNKPAVISLQSYGGQTAMNWNVPYNDNVDFNTYTNHGIDFMTNNLDRMTILAGGNVGIGTTSPGAKLEVNGNITASSVTVNGELGIKTYKFNRSSATVDTDYDVSFSSSSKYWLALVSTTTLTFSSVEAGDEMVFSIEQSSNSKGVVWPAYVDWGDSGAIILSTTTRKVDTVFMECLSATYCQATGVRNGFTAP